MVRANVAISGLLLVNDFQNTQILIGTIEGADYRARMSEEEILSRFSSYKQAEAVLVNPNDLPLKDDAELVRESLNAHIQKVQSEQIKNYGVHTIQDLEHKVDELYLNKKIKILVLDKKLGPIHNSWVDNRTGEPHLGDTRAVTVSGRIAAINLADNYIVIKPTMLRKFLNNSLIEYLVEIINLDSLQPMVSIAII
jgi:hypothetical protein